MVIFYVNVEDFSFQNMNIIFKVVKHFYMAILLYNVSEKNQLMLSSYHFRAGPLILFFTKSHIGGI